MLISFRAGAALTILFSAVCALQDLKTMTIDLRLLLSMATAQFAFLAVCLCCGQSPPWQSILPAAVTGLLLLLFSFASGGALGEGDALFFLLLGTAAGFRCQLLILFLTMLSAGLFALFYVVAGMFRGRSRRSECLPLLPFTLLPSVCVLLPSALAAGGAP